MLSGNRIIVNAAYTFYKIFLSKICQIYNFCSVFRLNILIRAIGYYENLFCINLTFQIRTLGVED